MWGAGAPDDTTNSLDKAKVIDLVHYVRLVEYNYFASDDSDKW